ncbi:MAG: sigma-70 family RNA polymerase sigma factor [Verrucomicrobiota bacterium]
MEDSALLKAFSKSGAEDAFQALVQRHLGLVRGIALRRTGDSALAEEIAQNVFTVLARKAHRLMPHSTLAGWLYRTTMIECAEALRRRYAHERKMKAFSEAARADTNGHSVWKDALPLLDEAMDALPAADRDIILQRFFERKGFRDIGAALGKSEDAAQKQTERALQKLNRILQRKGVVLSAVALASGLAAQLAHAAPAGLAQAVTQGAIAGAQTWNAKILILKTLQAMNVKTKLAAAVVVAAAIPLAMQWNENADLRREVAQLKQQLADALKSRAPARPTPTAAVARPRSTARSEMAAPAATAASPSPEAKYVSALNWRQALFEQDPVRRAQAIAQLLAELTAATAPEAAQAFADARANGSTFGEEYRLFLRAWGKLDGAAAVAHLTSSGGKLTNSAEMLAALAGWASANPHNAKAWIETLPEDAPREDLIYGLLDGWSMVDFRGASAYAESRPRSAARDGFRELLLQRSLAAGGIAGAQDWFARIPDDEHNSLYKQRAFGEVIKAMLYRDPSAAAQWIAQLGGHPCVTGDAVKLAAAKLAESSPSQAMHWLQSLSSLGPDQLTAGLTKVVDAWSRQDPHAAGTWLNQNRQHPAYDTLAARFARSLAAENPMSALAWAASINDDKARRDNELAIARDYLKRGGDAAMAQLQAAGWSPESIEAARKQSTSVRYALETGQVLAEQAVVYLADELMTATADVELFSVNTIDAVDWTWKAATSTRNPHGNQYANTSCTQCHAQGVPRTDTVSEQLLRRLSLDLRGLPPTAGETQTLAGQEYKAAVRALLGSQYGYDAQTYWEFGK